MSAPTMAVLLTAAELDQIHLGLCTIELRPSLSADQVRIASAKAKVLDARYGAAAAQRAWPARWIEGSPSAEEKKAQAARCACQGHDVRCVCQNMIWRPPA